MHDRCMARIRHPRVPGNNIRVILQINTANPPSWHGMPWIRAAVQSVNGYTESAEQSRTAEHFWLAAWCHVIKFRILPFHISNMVLKVNVIDLEYEEVLSILASQQYTVCEKLSRPRAGEVYVCLNTKEGLFLTSFWCFLLLIRYDTRCYFNLRSKAGMSQLNLPHGTDN